MEKTQITKAQIAELANKIRVEPAVLQTVINIESSGRGFDATGRIKIQFEPYYFQKYTGQRVANGVGNQTEEWNAFDEAFKLDPHAAKMSTSWGMGQIMGFNFNYAGFGNVDEMVKEFAESEYNQVLGMVNLISKTSLMIAPLRSKNWALFAKAYNGPSYFAMKYDTKLATEYQFLIDSKY